jgi:hypothetical protein
MHWKCDTTDELVLESLPTLPGPVGIGRLLFGWFGLGRRRPSRGRDPLLSSGRFPTREERVFQLVLGELTVRAEREEPSVLNVLLTGKSASRDAGRELQPVFDRLLSGAKEENRSLLLHFERLDYFNSSTIAALVQFIRTAQLRGVSLVVRYDAALKWQAMSFEALRRALKPFESQGGPSLEFDGGAGR